MRTSTSVVVALILAVVSPVALSETAPAEPAKSEAPAVLATQDNSAEAAKPDARPNAVEPLESGLNQQLCVQK